MKNYPILLTSLVLLFLLSSTSSFSQLIFTQKTLKQFSIVCPKQATEDEKNAALLFQKYLKEIFASELKIGSESTKKNAIYFHTIDLLNPDGYQIEITKNGIGIIGGQRKGNTYAVIHLLEKYFGCSYLSPTYKVIPHPASVELPITSINEAPQNDVRIINLYFNENQEYIDWLRLNSIEEVYPEGYFVHTFHRLVPWEKYFNEHPEYFALVNGKRSIDQLCTSNPEVRDLIAQRLKEEMKLQPEKIKWSVSQNDNFSYCQCDKCKEIIEEEGSPAGPIIYLVNDIAARFPNKYISTLAYQYSRKAPLKVKPLKNVEVMLCTIELYRHLAIATNPESADFKKDMEDWGKICSNIFLWDYTINFNHSISPFPNLQVLQPNIQFFTKNNVNALFEQSNSTTGYEFSELKAFLLAKLMWDPNIDFEKEKDLFLKTYYGNAAPFIKEYIQALENALNENKSKLWIYEHPVVHQDGLFSESNLLKFNQIFNDAAITVAKDSALLNHVKLARLPLQYAEMEIATNHMFSKRGWYELVNGKAIPNQQLLNTLDEFERTCLFNKVPTVNESGLTPENYISSLRGMIEVNIEGNLAFGKKVVATTPPDKKYQNGDLSYLTNGVNGASDYNIHWLGWFGNDTELTIDLDDITTSQNISIHSLWNGKSWILHPAQIACSISEDGITFSPLGSISIEGNQQTEEIIKTYQFDAKGKSYRYVRFLVTGTHQLPDWHPSAGQPSWFFLDEIIVK